MSQATTTDGETHEENAQRWPTPSDRSFPCTQQSHVSDSQINKEDELAAAEARLEQMGYKRPFPCPTPIEFEDTFPLPEHAQDARAVKERMAVLEQMKEDLWNTTGERRRKGKDIECLLYEAENATKVYLDYLEQIRSGRIRPVDAPSFRREGNKLAAMRMYLLEAMAGEAIRKRPKFDI